MERKEAINTLQEIIACTGYYLNLVVLAKTEELTSASDYELRLKGRISEVSRQEIQKIAQERNLCLSEEEGLFILH